MDDFAKLSPEERKPYFETAAAQEGIAEHIVEKDFWVCWTLKRLFTLPMIEDQLIFKGGTSLSKVFHVIERFSEDIDISLSKTLLGFTGDKDPEQSHGSKQVGKSLEALSEACKSFVQNKLKQELEAVMRSNLSADSKWSLEIDTDDPDGQTLLFHYPTESGPKGRYVSPMVKIEIGARSDQWPAHPYIVFPMLKNVTGALSDPDTSVKTLDAARTFWEKATILHAYANYPDGKIPAARQSRHYYDFYQLLQSKHKAEAVSNLALLERVVEHKSIYFRSSWSNYAAAKKGTLKLMPNAKIKDVMRRDYFQMQEMFFNTPPEWDEILKVIKSFEIEFNS